MSYYVHAGLMLLVVVFFVKGAGEPFGLIFRMFLASVPGAGLIRTPDTKFGIFVILALSVAFALALAGQERNTRWFRVLARAVIVAVVAYHAVPLVNGQAILARDSELVPDRTQRGYAVALSPAERRVIELLAADPAVGVVVLPPAFGLATRREDSVFLYRHVISDFISNPVYYAGWNEAPSEGVKQLLRAGVEGGDWEALTELGVGFVLVNRNAVTDKAAHHVVYQALKAAPTAWSRLVDDGGYELYRRVGAPGMPLRMTSESGPVSVRIVDQGGWYARFHTAPLAPGRYALSFRSAENRHWRLLPVPEGCGGSVHVCAVRALIAPAAGYSIERHASASEFVNRWSLVKQSLGAAAGGSMMVVFIPQLWMSLFLAVATATALLCCYYLIRQAGKRESASSPGSARA
jgi:hypothetical protein